MTDVKSPDSESVAGNAWWAIIGPIPTPPSGGLLATPHDQGRALAQPVTIGPLQLAGGGRALVEWLTCEPDTLFGVTKFVSWPIITGSAAGRRGDIPYREGSRQLHRLVCLLALAWGEPWQERSAPGSPDAIPPHIPDHGRLRRSGMVLRKLTRAEVTKSCRAGFRQFGTLSHPTRNWQPRRRSGTKVCLPPPATLR